MKSLNAHRARALLGARSQLVGMTARLSNHIRGVLKTFGLLPGAVRGLPFDRRVEVLLGDQSDLAPIVRPRLTAWRRLREQIAVLDKAIRAIVKQSATCRLLMSVPGIGALSVLAYVSTVEDPRRFCPITIGRSAPGTDADAISVGRERSQRQDLPLRHNLAPR